MSGRLLGIVGPTASGKSELALALVGREPIEILVADSRQVYRGMDVGTATPDAVARAGVPHHLLDLVDPDQPFSVAQWLTLARRALAGVEARGRLPVLVGGTGLYVGSLLDGHDYASQPWSPAVRQALAAELDAAGLASLVERLEQLDSATAERIDRRNPRRVLRALERAELAGGPVTPAAAAYDGQVTLLALDRPREVLYRRIDRRTRQMFETGGLLAEVQALLDAGYGPELRPMSGHGYAEAFRHLAGEWSLEQAIEVTARRTRQYAKRQLSWFRRDPRIRWLPAGDGPADVPPLVEEVVAAALDQPAVGRPID